MKLYDGGDLSALQGVEGAQEQAHLRMLIALKQTENLISNVKTLMKAIPVEGAVLPVTINHVEYDTSYVCSIYTAFISYARTEVKKIKSPWIERVMRILLHLLDGLLKKAKIDQVVSHNNFLLSTNLYPDVPCDPKTWWDHTQQIIKQYPDHAIIFRSLNAHTNPDWMSKLKTIGFQLCPSRQVYIFDRTLRDYRKSHNYKIDLNLLEKKTTYQKCYHEQITKEDYPRIAQLYNELYIKKYSIYNPIFTAAYIQASYENGFIEYFGLRNSAGRLDAILGCYDRGNVTTAPVVGYDTALDPKLGLYRMLMAHCINRADQKNLILNLSSGASHFKLLRGGVAYIEYSALYVDHLSNLFQRSVWRVLRGLLTHVVVPIMVRFKL